MAGKEASNKPTLMERSKTELQKAAWQAGSEQFSKLVKKGLVTILVQTGVFGKPGGKGAQAKKVAAAAEAFEEVLNSQVGDIIVMGLIGFGMEHIPMIKDDPRVLRLAEENRIGAMRTGMSAVAGVAMEQFMPLLSSALKALPEVPAETETVKVRVGTEVTKDTEADAETENEAVEESTASQRKKLQVGS